MNPSSFPSSFIVQLHDSRNVLNPHLWEVIQVKGPFYLNPFESTLIDLPLCCCAASSKPNTDMVSADPSSPVKQSAQNSRWVLWSIVHPHLVFVPILFGRWGLTEQTSTLCNRKHVITELVWNVIYVPDLCNHGEFKLGQKRYSVQHNVIAEALCSNINTFWT